jgi:hypothetical protein
MNKILDRRSTSLVATGVNLERDSPNRSDLTPKLGKTKGRNSEARVKNATAINTADSR